MILKFRNDIMTKGKEEPEDGRMMRDGMKHILIVEDDPAVLGLVVQALTGKYRISEADSEEEAIKIFSENHPDLILLDAAITGSMEFLTGLRDLPGLKEVPVLFLVDHDQQQTQRIALKCGAADIITKPPLPDIIIKRVGYQLELRDYRISDFEFINSQDAISVSIAELVECRDITTGGHLKNTTAYFRLLLEEIISLEEFKDRIPAGDVRDLIRSAPLHDIGKIGINDDILRKASSLDYNEYEYMKTHTILGKETFDKIMKETGETRLLTLARDLAYCHHEKWDGTGYPNGLKGEEIPFYARILTIADVYDALTSQRAYKEAFPHQKAVDIIREGKGSFFDPELAEIFLKINDRFERVLMMKNGK